MSRSALRRRPTHPPVRPQSFSGVRERKREGEVMEERGDGGELSG